MRMVSFPLCAFIFLATLVSSCGGDQQGDAAKQVPGVTDSTVLVGTWGPLTGPAALWGSVSKGIDAYFKMLNEEGGIEGRRIELILKDDGYDPSRTVPAVREMAQKDEVFAFVGGIGTANGMAVMDFITETGIPWISPISGSSSWAYPPKERVFSVFPLYFDEGEIQAQYAVDRLGLSKIAVVYQNDDYGMSGLVGARRVLEGRGLSPAAEVTVEVTDTDLTSQVARLQQSEAEAVLLWTAPRQAAILVSTAASLGFHPNWIAASTLSDMTLMYDITKGAWEGVVATYFGEMPYGDDSPSVNKYRQAFEKYYPGERWGIFPYAGFFYAEPFVEGLRRAGRDLTQASLVVALEGISNYPLGGGSGPTISFGPDQRQGLRSCYLVKCVGPTEYEILSERIEATSDPMELAKELHGTQ